MNGVRIECCFDNALLLSSKLRMAIEKMSIAFSSHNDAI